MTLNPENISLQSLDDLLAARNEQGHLTAPMLFLDREAVPDDAEDFGAVLVFSDGKTRAVIDSTILVLHKGNDYTQTLGIETGGTWTLSEINENYVFIDPEQREGFGDVQIDVSRALAMQDVPGFHGCDFLLTIDGAVASEQVIHVFIFNGKGLGAIQHTSITLDENNDYEYTLAFLEGCSATDVNEAYFTVEETDESGVFLVKANDPPQNYDGVFFFEAYDPEEDDSIIKVRIVHIGIDVSKPLQVQYGNDIAKNGETLTVTFTAPYYNSPYQDAKSLTITRDRHWEILYEDDADSDKLTASPSEWNGNYETSYVTLSKPSEFIVGAEAIEMTLKVVSGKQCVTVKVIYQPPLSGKFIDPPDDLVAGEDGAPGGTDQVYIYL
jgi:hypothetical protein